MKNKLLNLSKSRWFLAVGCLILGALIVMGIRVATYHKDETHYHANFAVYINGQREQFKSPTYYEEVSMCEAENGVIPAVRGHMHDEKNDVVHVEDHAVTWGQFFENLGWYLGPDFIQSSDGAMHKASGNQQLHLMLNGQDYTGLGGLTNSVIKDQDKLLVSFGDVNTGELKQEYSSIPSTAAHYDNTPDPETCSGHEQATMRERMRHMF